MLGLILAILILPLAVAIASFLAPARVAAGICRVWAWVARVEGPTGQQRAWIVVTASP